MDWILLEDGRLINMELITDVRFIEHGLHEGKATAWCGGVIMGGESRILGDWYKRNRDAILAKRASETTVVQRKKIARYGWKKDRPDSRDLLMAPPPPDVALPISADLRTGCPPIYDQGQLGSCTAHGISGGVDFARAAQGKPFMSPSRLFIYFNERSMEGTVGEDSGAEIRDGIKSVAAQGVCPESEWPYSDQGTQFTDKPTDQCYADALKFKALTYSRVTQNAYHTKHCLGILKKPIIFGFNVFDAFESDEVAQTGIVPMPGASDTPVGGHCVMAVGYDDSKGMFLCRNSWGTSWGQQGYFWMPYDYVLNPNLASDFWVIEVEE